MINAKLEDISEKNLSELCEDSYPESQTLEFKRTLPSFKDEREKQTFINDICAMANAQGGDIIYGIGEKDGKAEKIFPIEISSADELKRRLGQILENGAEPRISPLFKVVLVENGCVIVARIAQSFNGPHRCKFGDTGRFLMRSGTHNIDLTYNQLRMAFGKTSTIIDRIRTMRAERIEKHLQYGGAVQPIADGARGVIHIFPVEGISGNQSVNIAQLHDSGWEDFLIKDVFDLYSSTRRLNLDGLVCGPRPTPTEPAAYHTQVYRNGMLETAFFAGILHPPDQEKRYILPARLLAARFREIIINGIKQLYKLDFSGPTVIGLSLLNVSSYKLGTRTYMYGSTSCDRANLIVPDLWYNNIGNLEKVDLAVQSLLDILWQSFNQASCDEYTNDGVWLP